MDCFFVWNCCLFDVCGVDLVNAKENRYNEDEEKLAKFCRALNANKMVDFKKEISGVMEKEAEAQALIGNEVVQGMADINNARKEVEKDIKDFRKEFKKEIKADIRTMGGKLKK